MKLRTIIISLLFIVVLGTTAFAATGKITNANSGLILRTEPSKLGSVITTVSNGTEVEVIEKNGDWYKVRVGEKEGYLFAEFVKVDEEIKEPADKSSDGNNISTEINVYVMPMITAKIISVLPQGTEITVIDSVGKWSYISANGVIGWVRTYKITGELQESTEQVVEKNEKTTELTEVEELETKPEETVETVAEPLKRGYINVQSANVREGASLDAKIVSTLILNTGVEITGEEGNWYKINYQDKVFGYILKDLISAKQN